MKLTRAGSPNSPVYYVQKTVRVGDRTTSKTIERLGTLEEIKKRSGDQDPLEWAKEYVNSLTLKENQEQQEVVIRQSAIRQIEKGVLRSVNIGYLFLQDVYYSLGLDKICSKISERYKFEYDLNDILSMLVYTRILFPSSKRSSLQQAQVLLEKPDCDLHQVYRGLEILAKENDFFQAQLYKNSEKAVGRKHGVLYYDCTNYYFEIEKADDFRKYGISKENRPNPIVQMGMFMDADGIPLAFSVFNGNDNEQPSMAPLEKKIINDYGVDAFIVCTDSSLSSMDNRKLNDIKGRKFVTVQPIKKLKGFLQDFCLSDEGWHLEGSRKTYRLSELDKDADYDKLFYKDRWINEDDLEQHLIVTFSLKYQAYQQSVRKGQIDRAAKMVNDPSKLKQKKQNDPKRFIHQEHCTDDGEIADNTVTSLDDEKIEDEAKYDGYYAVCTNLDDDVNEIIKINKRRWEIEQCFRIMKNEFRSRPVYLSRKDRITAHFMTCFTALIVYRILEKRLGGKYSCGEITKTLRDMNMLVYPGEGYIPEYTRTDVTDALHEEFGFRTDYEIISHRNMKKICTATKRRKK